MLVFSAALHSLGWIFAIRVSPYPPKPDAAKEGEEASLWVSEMTLRNQLLCLGFLHPVDQFLLLVPVAQGFGKDVDVMLLRARRSYSGASASLR